MAVSRKLARQALDSVGDAELGEWAEDGERGVVHLRRRLSRREQILHAIGEPVDVRGTPEVARRFAEVERAYA